MQAALQAQRLLDLLPWRIAGPLKRRFPAPVRYYFIVSIDPLIIIIPEDFCDDPVGWEPFFESLRNKDVTFLGLIRGGIDRDSETYKTNFQRMMAAHRASFPNHSFIMLANNPAQIRIFEDIGHEHVFINQNCMIDESPFNIQPGVERRYDAIHNGVALPFKRHELTTQVENLAILTYLKNDHLVYFHEIAEKLKSSHWLNFPGNDTDPSNFRYFRAHEICDLLNQARVGLCLSAFEGAMWASIEYMLCGLPIVTTPSFGGRDVFFEEEFVITVDSQASAVAKGVRDMIAREVNPDMIRQATLKRIEMFRQRFVALIQKIHAAHGKNINSTDAYAALFPKPIYKLRPIHELLRLA